LEYLKESQHETRKILFTGLDDAGKTSIILALQGEFSRIANIEPTRGAQRRMFGFLGKDISEWDLGGQSSYRISYLKNPNKYFAETEALIYVIDVQNRQRMLESISYLSDVVHNLVYELNIKPPIFFFFHKYDPALTRESYNEMNVVIDYIKENLKKIQKYYKFHYYKTSIYNLGSVISAVSEILLTLYPKTDVLQNTVYEYAKKFDIEAIEIIDSNSLIVGSYYQNERIRDILVASTPYFLSLNASFDSANNLEELSENKMIVQRFNRYFLFLKIAIQEGYLPYYLLICKDTPEIEKGDYDSLINFLKELLYK
jgi:GTPase SAR1 family protein